MSKEKSLFYSVFYNKNGRIKLVMYSDNQFTDKDFKKIDAICNDNHYTFLMYRDISILNIKNVPILHF